MWCNTWETSTTEHWAWVITKETFLYILHVWGLSIVMPLCFCLKTKHQQFLKGMMMEISWFNSSCMTKLMMKHVDQENPQFVEAIWWLLTAYPETINNWWALMSKLGGRWDCCYCCQSIISLCLYVVVLEIHVIWWHDTSTIIGKTTPEKGCKKILVIFSSGCRSMGNETYLGCLNLKWCSYKCMRCRSTCSRFSLLVLCDDSSSS